jgi:ATP-binding cassette subfamily B protein
VTETEPSAAEQASIEEIVGVPPPRRGALRRDWHLIGRILPYLRPFRKMAVFSVLITILLAVVALAEPWPLAFVVDSVIGHQPPPSWVTPIFGSGTGALIALAVVATLLLTLLSGGMTVLNEYLSTSVDQRMVLDLRSDMFKHAQKLSLAFHDDERKGVLMYRINQQAASMGQIVVGLPTLAQSALTIVGMGYIAFRINHLLALLALGITPFVAYSTTYYADRIEPRIYRVRGLGAVNLAIVYESMAMMRVVLAFGHERREFKRFRKQGERWVDGTIGLTVRQTAFKLAVNMITSAGTAAVIGVGAYQAVNGEITAGQLIVVLSYINQIYQPLEDLTTTLTQFQQWFIGLRMSFELLDMNPEVIEKPNARKLERGRGEIELEHVNFRYKTRDEVLKDVSFRVPPGRAVAIVGPTGAGKSTLASLLPRFYDPQQGRVLIDGIDVRDLNLDSLRAQFSIVLQDPLLFSGTILDNIRYGDPSASIEQVEEAAKAANAHEFITQLEDGYETRVGEGGTKISGGERQRIAVARAFLRDAPILILDEPTSSIDSRTESVILEALDRLMEGRTTIVIAHRLSTLRGVDQILVLNEGELVESGTHAELVERNGLYRQLWEAQTRVARGRHPLAPASAAAELETAKAATSHLAGANGAGGPEPERPSEERPAIGTGKTAALPRPKIVLLGMLTPIPYAGVAWLVGQYAAGFQRLGYDVYYVEAHSRTPIMFMKDEDDRGTEAAAHYISEVARRFGLGDRWAFQALHEGGRCLGMSAEELDRLYRDAALIINMHGGTLPLPEHAATDRLIYLGTDPVAVELEVHRGERDTIEFLDQHVAFFTWGLNYGNPDCLLPWARSYSFVPSPPPVILDFWDNDFAPDDPAPFTTIGNWRQGGNRSVEFEGKVYGWSKHAEFLKILDLPSRVETPIELALSRCEAEDRKLLEDHGWRVRSGLDVSEDLDSYSVYIVRSGGELSAAKEQNVHFRSGWFSERSATYLAAGRPVVLQDTGFGNALPTGEGLFAFRDVEGAAEAIQSVEREPARHRRAAREIAREYLSYDVVLGDMLDHMGLAHRKRPHPATNSPAPAQLPHDLDLRPRSRRPLRIAEETLERVTRRPIPTATPSPGPPFASIVMPVLDNLVPTRMALESVLANTHVPYEVIVVDNASAEPTRDYLAAVAARNRHVRLIRNERNRGFAAACNQGLAAARADRLVFLNNDTIVPPEWLAGLTQHLADSAIGLVGPTTNRCGGAAEIRTSYTSYGEMLRFANERRQATAGRPPVDIAVAQMFCAAIRGDVFEKIGHLDERFEIGMFEDDDYSRRVREAGYRVVCAEDAFVHHFGEASIGQLAADGRYGEVFHGNRRRFEEKWGVRWESHDRRWDPDYAALTLRVAALVREQVPEGSTVLVVSKGDDAFVEIDGRDVRHFPQLEDGTYSGSHPADDDEAIAELERLRKRGAEYLVLPASSMWWLDHYEGFRRHLERYTRSGRDPATAVIYKLAEPVAVETELRELA